MHWTDREAELKRLSALCGRREGGLGVVYGRRRIGKTRLLLEWTKRNDGVYTVADQSTPDIQRRYVARALAERLPGFADVEYPDWNSLLERVAREAKAVDWRGPVVFDEFPYLVGPSPELPSVMQRWVDHAAREARLSCAIAGSSQRMMQGLALTPNAPLCGRASEILLLGPLPVSAAAEVFGVRQPSELVSIHAAWGGVPRYWELAADLHGRLTQRIDALVLDPSGPLHVEPDRLLLEELPPAIELRPILDAVGAGAHRLSEIAGRVGRAATSLSRPLDRLIGLGLLRREVPFGEPEKKSKRSLYRIDDPFTRLWFRVVAPHRALLLVGNQAARLEILARHLPALLSTAWEDLCRALLPQLGRQRGVGRLGPFGAAGRWWHGNAPEWDVVARSLDGSVLLLGEAKWSERPLAQRTLQAHLHDLITRDAPEVASRRGVRVVRALFVPEVRTVPPTPKDVHVVTGRELLQLPG